VIYPYLDGRDLTNEREPVGSRFAIRLSGMTREQAERYQAAFEYLQSTVALERESLGDYKQHLKDEWWQFEYEADKMYRGISRFERVIAMGRTTKYFQPILIPTGQIINSKIVVWDSDDLALMGELASVFHDVWSRQYAVPLGSKAFTYSQAKIFDTFPRPAAEERSQSIAEAMHEVLDCRAALLGRGAEGLTGVYNQFHAPGSSGAVVHALRKAHAVLDVAVAEGYQSSDMPELRYEFVEDRTVPRWTLPQDVRREVVDFLLTENRDQSGGAGD
jgi:hypothetical protein